MLILPHLAMSRLLPVIPALLGGLTLVQSSDPIVLSNEIQRVSNESLLWGPYNPGLYFGMRPRIPKSVNVGLIYGNVEDYRTAQNNFRHTCEQGDDMKGYGWVEYDVRNGGKQILHDAGNKIDLQIDLVKVPGGKNGGSWGARIKGKPRKGEPKNVRTALWVYATVEGDGEISLENEPEEQGFTGPVSFKGHSPGLDEFHIEVTEGPSTNRHPTELDPRMDELGFAHDVSKTLYRSGHYPDEHIWRVKNILFMELKQHFDTIMKHFEGNLPPPYQVFAMPPSYAEGNVHLVQKTFEGAFEFDILFSSDSAPKALTSEIVTEKIKENEASFGARFDKIFKRQRPFDNEDFKEFGKDLFSNLLGGIGYFHGKSLVDRSDYPEDEEAFWEPAKANREKDLGQEEGPTTLFTSIPSRPFFPRGFLWDEGFHLLPVIEWDVDLAMQIVKSWFNLIDEDGWIAREQILGEEARNKVPREFQTQYPHYANPPTLLLVLTRFIEKWNESRQNENPSIQGDISQIMSQMSGFGGDGIPYAILASAEPYLKDIYPLLRRQYYWFRETQSGEIRAYDRTAFSSKEAYRWRGRAPGYCLTSGIDDYPRPEPPHPGELHVDLISWMGFSARLMKNIAVAIGEVDDAKQYSKHEEAILRNIDDLHWNDSIGCYCDATIDSFEENKQVCHVGYVSIFPFLLGLIPHDSKKIGRILNILCDEDQLWSQYGIRSLSKQDEFFAQGENYWRGSVWINMNYLALLRLKEIGSVEGPFQSHAAALYSQLRTSIVNNVYDVWEDTGFAWEQYQEDSGKGKGVKHFLGWTSLVVNMMAMPESVGPIPKPEVHDEL